MKITLTLTIQKAFEAKNDDDADAKVNATVKALEAQGWSVNVEDDSSDEEEGEEGDEEEEGGDDE